MKKAVQVLIMVSLMLTMTACWGNDDNSSSNIESSMPPSSSEYSSQDEGSSVPPQTSSMPEEFSTSIPNAPTMSADLSQIGTLNGESVPWGPGTHKGESGRPIACIDLQDKYGEYDAYFVAPAEKKVYLTFDGGYENGYTAKILDVLKEKNTPAVFFVTLPYAKGQPELIKRMIDEGHIVGNHSAGHPNFTKISLQEAMEDTTELHNYMLEEYDYTMHLFRYPEGAFSEQSLALLQQMGYRTLFWSFAYADWDPSKQMAPTDAYEKVTANLHDGAIYLLHAVSATNTEILGDVIDNFRALGYELAPATDLL